MVDMGILFDGFLMFTAILLAGSLSGYLSERVGIVNIGIDGMMCIGALFFGIYSSPMLGMSDLGFGMLIFPIFLTMISTTLMGALHAFATIKLKANHIISGTAINMMGLSFATFLNSALANSLYNGATKLQSGFVSFDYLGNGIYLSSIILFSIILIIAGCIYIFMRYTKIGLRYNAIGENPNAVDAQGINVIKYQWIGVLLSSAMAGLAGALFLFNAGQFAGNTAGLGFLALAIMVAGGWKIEWITLISICFALFTSLSSTNILTNMGVPKEIAFSLPYAITIVVLIAFSKRNMAPAHDGIPFDKTKR
ncbi:MAG: ABC transporter permease [Mycoplasmataceae bacterium]|jgi:simple sugar transport system permease protein|nr:ABC transporter permease [Mycoplasmataceae bacterium]